MVTPVNVRYLTCTLYRAISGLQARCKILDKKHMVKKMLQGTRRFKTSIKHLTCTLYRAIRGLQARCKTLVVQVSYI